MLSSEIMSYYIHDDIDNTINTIRSTTRSNISTALINELIVMICDSNPTEKKNDLLMLLLSLIAPNKIGSTEFFFKEALEASARKGHLAHIKTIVMYFQDVLYLKKFDYLLHRVLIISAIHDNFHIVSYIGQFISKSKITVDSFLFYFDKFYNLELLKTSLEKMDKLQTKLVIYFVLEGHLINQSIKLITENLLVADLYFIIRDYLL